MRCCVVFSLLVLSHTDPRLLWELLQIHWKQALLFGARKGKYHASGSSWHSTQKCLERTDCDDQTLVDPTRTRLPNWVPQAQKRGLEDTPASCPSGEVRRAWDDDHLAPSIWLHLFEPQRGLFPVTSFDTQDSFVSTSYKILFHHSLVILNLIVRFLGQFTFFLMYFPMHESPKPFLCHQTHHLENILSVFCILSL